MRWLDEELYVVFFVYIGWTVAWVLEAIGKQFPDKSSGTVS